MFSNMQSEISDQ